jgi:hypothetical protein
MAIGVKDLDNLCQHKTRSFLQKKTSQGIFPWLVEGCFTEERLLGAVARQ